MGPKKFEEFINSKDSRFFFKDLTEKIIGAALEVHTVLGTGFLEYVYHEALCHELKLRKVSFKSQQQLDIRYKDLLISKKIHT